MNDGYYKVRFRVNESGVVVEKGFQSLYNARKFVLRLKHSKKCTLLSYPNFD